MFGFGLLKKEERGTLGMNKRKLELLLEKAGVSLLSSTTMGTILPNKTPLPILPLLRLIDCQNPLGFYAVAVGRK